MKISEMSSADLSASPVELKVGERTHRMFPLTEGDFGEFERWVRSQVIGTARDACAEITNEAERSEVMEAAFRTAAKITMGSAETQSAMRSISGMQRLAWYSLRRGEARLTFERAQRIISDAGGIVPVMEKLAELSGGTPEEPTPAHPQSAAV